MAGKKSQPVLPQERFQIFICYSHADNDSSDRRSRWLDRLIEFLAPLKRQGIIEPWSDKKIEMGDHWHENIQARLERSHAVILLVSPAFLDSAYVAKHELPFILSSARRQRLPVIPILISPSLFEEASYRFKGETGIEEEFRLAQLQSANPPDETLIEVSEAEQNRIFLGVAKQLYALVGSMGSQHDVAVAESPTSDEASGGPVLLAQFRTRNGRLQKQDNKSVAFPSYCMNIWIAGAPARTEKVTFEIDDLNFKDRIWTEKIKQKSVRDFLTKGLVSWGDIDIWARGFLTGEHDWLIKSSLYSALKRYYGYKPQPSEISEALEQIREN